MHHSRLHHFTTGVKTMPTQKTVDPAEVHSIKQELSRENTLEERRAI